MIHSIQINDFRIFKDKNIKFGKYITAIAGKNGLGKSTILALVGNSCELKEKNIFGKNFRTEFNEIFKAHPDYDKSGSNKCKINFSTRDNPDEITDYRKCRIAWQGNQTRFRVIPEHIIDGKKRSSKKEFPSLYLGLSRLYPIGESSDINLSVKEIKLTESEKLDFIHNYINILSLDIQDSIKINSIDIKNNKKYGIGIDTDEYHKLSNSAGQDNIGQILLYILSFERLKSQLKEIYPGGVLLIDELDATLHPAAQIKLINYLFKKCKSLNLQLIFTTHSSVLLKHICNKTTYNKENILNDYEIVYLTKQNGPLKIMQNPDYYLIENDLFISKPGANIKRVTVYSEDEETRWFFKHLISNDLVNLSSFFNMTDIKLGCDVLFSLIKGDPKYFSNILFVFDGDVSEEKIKENNISNNIIKLPGQKPPEEVIYDFLCNLDYDDEFWDEANTFGLNIESLKEHGPDSNDYTGYTPKRLKNKEWFKTYKTTFEDSRVLEFWIKYNIKEFDDFITNLISTYNKISKRTLSNPIYLSSFSKQSIENIKKLNGLYK